MSPPVNHLSKATRVSSNFTDPLLPPSEVTTDFWVGGRFVNETVGWSWVNDEPMILGSPYWAVR